MHFALTEQILLSLKCFETIGFHHQGHYSIGVEIPSQKLVSGFNVQVGLGSQILQNDTKFVSQKFEISFNEQEIIFENHSIKIQFESTPSPKEVEKERDDFLEIGIVLNRHHQEDEGEDGMVSTENIIKGTGGLNTLEDEEENPKNNKVQKDKKEGKCWGDGAGDKEGQKGQGKKDKKKKGSKEIEKVGTVTLRICRDGEVDSGVSMLQVLNFPQQQYFGKLYYSICYVKTGYILRSNLDNYWEKTRELQKLKNKEAISLAIRGNPSEIQPPQANAYHKANKKTLSVEELSELLLSQFGTFCNVYKNVVINFTKEVYKVDQLLHQLEKLLSKLQVHEISLQVEQWGVDIETLIETRLEIPKETHSQNELQEIYADVGQIWGQGQGVSRWLMVKWKVVELMFQKLRWNALYYWKGGLAFRESLEWLKDASVTNVNTFPNPLPEHTVFPLPLIYKYFIHEMLPNLYIKKHQKVQKILAKDERSQSSLSNENILFVLVHGFNGNEQDMSRIKSYLGYFCTPHFLVIKNISKCIGEPLNVLGEVAAEEIKEWLKTRNFIRRINFIGFSLGGVIIRASLPYLNEVKEKFNLLITLSSPHLGVQQLKSCLVRTGMHMLQKIKGVKNIKELLLDSDGQPQQSAEIGASSSNYTETMPQVEQSYSSTSVSFMQKLAKDKSIGCFKEVIVCGSEEDKYVPAYSSILSYTGPDPIISEMQQDIINNAKNLHQICVKFHPSKKGTFWERVSGRRVHINFLDDDAFLHILFALYFQTF